MQRLKSFFLILSLLAFIFGAAAYGVVLFSLKPQDIQKKLVENVETLTDSRKYKKLDMGLEQ